jgi:hypothetical protein
MGMKRNIKKFGFDGVIFDDSHLVGKKEYYTKLLEDQMRVSGYVPVLDLDIQFFISYNKVLDSYNFSIYMFGVYVGKKKAQNIVGFSGTNFI